MGKKLLLAIDDCVESLKAVRYAANVCSALGELTYTLYNVQPPIPSVFSEMAEKEPEVNAEVDELTFESTEVKRCMYGSLKDHLVQSGISEELIETVSEPPKEGLKKDILARAEQGGYDAIVLARGGLTSRKDFFISSTAATIAEHSFKIPVWIVDGEDVSMHFLLPVDGSQSSIKEIDHVTAMIGENQSLNVTIFHVVPLLRHYYSLDFEKKSPRLQKLLQQHDKERFEKFLEVASEKFENAGLKRSQIKTKIEYQGYDISTSILREVRQGKYSTVVIGRRGERDAFFTGRITARLLQKISGQTLWIVP